MPKRSIFHADLDAFFVAVEVKLEPKLKGKPVIVGGLGPRGVVSTASYEARRFGVHSGMAVSSARRICPKGVFLQGRHGVYGTYSKAFMRILEDFTPVIQTMSVDEAYLDMTGTAAIIGTPMQAAAKIRSRVRRELGITVSIGIAPNKLVAKIASDMAKPDGQLEVLPEQVQEFLRPLPVGVAPGIGPKTVIVFQRLGIVTLGDLARFHFGWLSRELGERAATALVCKANGEDDSPVHEREGFKSLSAETTFDADVTSWEILRGTLLELTERVGKRLRAAAKTASTVQVKLRYHNFETVSKQHSLERPSDINADIFGLAERLVKEMLAQRDAPIRLIGVGVSRLAEGGFQMPMNWDSGRTRPPIDYSVDAIEEQYGIGTVRRGTALLKDRLVQQQATKDLLAYERSKK